MGHDEPFWQTNSSFSPPLSRRREQRLQSYGSRGDGGMALSSLSSNSKESRSWMRGERLPHHNYSTSDGSMSYLSSPSDIQQAQQLSPPTIQGVHIGEYASATMGEQPLHRPTFPQSLEGTSGITNSLGSTSSRSEGSDYGPMPKVPLHSNRNFSGRRSFMAKPVHPVSLPVQLSEVEEAPGSIATFNLRRSSTGLKPSPVCHEPQIFAGLDSIDYQRDASRCSSSSSIDFADLSNQLESQLSECLANNVNDTGTCGLCERLLSRRSPWCSRRIVHSGDMPVTGVLSCWHAFHAECLEKITPKTYKHDPPCPLCEKAEEKVPEIWALSRLKNGLPRLRLLGEEGTSTSRSWSCGQVGDCVEGALYASPRSNMLLNRSMLHRHRSSKVNPGEKLKRNEVHPARGFNRGKRREQAVGCSRTSGVTTLKRR